MERSSGTRRPRLAQKLRAATKKGASSTISAVGDNATLGWTNIPPIAPATETPVDLWFRTNPDSLGRVTDGLAVSYAIATPDTVAPSLSSTIPANGATVVADSNLVATFSEPIAIGSGDITVQNLSDGPTEDVVIAITDSSRVAVSGAVLTINPAADLPLGKNFAVRIAGTAIDDLVGNSFAGIGDAVTWTFSTPPPPPPPNIAFFDDFETGNNPAVLPATAGSYLNTPNVTTYPVANTSGLANNTLWMRASSGFASTRNGLVDDSENGGANFNDPAGSQAWAGRYSSNTGITTAEGVIGALAAGQTITASFDAVIDGSNNGSAIHAMLVAFNPGAARNAMESPTNYTAAVLKVLTGTATSSYRNHSFCDTVGDDVPDNNGGTGGGGTAWLESLLGKDLAIRFAHRNGSIVDNVQVTISGGAEDPPYLACGGRQALCPPPGDSGCPLKRAPTGVRRTTAVFGSGRAWRMRPPRPGGRGIRGDRHPRGIKALRRATRQVAAGSGAWNRQRTGWPTQGGSGGGAGG